MKKSHLVILLIIGFYLEQVGCQNNGKWEGGGWSSGISGSGPIEKETRNLTGYTKIESEISAEVILHPSATFRVEVEGQKNLAELLKTEVSGDVLRIYFSKSVGNYKTFYVHVYAPTFNSVSLKGSGNITCKEALAGASLDVYLRGSGDINMNQLTYKTMMGELTGSGNINLAGASDTSSWKLTGSGDVDCSSMKSKSSDAVVTGSGSIKCFASELVKARVRGSGDIYYKGSPVKIDKEVTGSGSIQAE
jgi:hypothetical protein